MEDIGEEDEEISRTASLKALLRSIGPKAISGSISSLGE